MHRCTRAGGVQGRHEVPLGSLNWGSTSRRGSSRDAAHLPGHAVHHGRRPCIEICPRGPLRGRRHRRFDGGAASAARPACRARTTRSTSTRDGDGASAISARTSRSGARPSLRHGLPDAEIVAGDLATRRAALPDGRTDSLQVRKPEKGRGPSVLRRCRRVHAGPRPRRRSD